MPWLNYPALGAGGDCEECEEVEACLGVEFGNFGSATFNDLGWSGNDIDEDSFVDDVYVVTVEGDGTLPVDSHAISGDVTGLTVELPEVGDVDAGEFVWFGPSADTDLTGLTFVVADGSGDTFSINSSGSYELDENGGVLFVRGGSTTVWKVRVVPLGHIT